MSTIIEQLERGQMRRLPPVAAGDRVRVHFQVVEGTRRRTQVFEGIVIRRQGAGVRETFTVRKQSFGVGVERTFPFHSPKIERIEVASRGDVRRAKLYYLRERVGKRARVRERRDITPDQVLERDLMYGEAEAEEQAPPEAEPQGEAEPQAEGAPAGEAPEDEVASADEGAAESSEAPQGEAEADPQAAAEAGDEPDGDEPDGDAAAGG